MIIVYVKHYLTDDGLLYFKNHWFPKVHSLISQQKGFISITYRENTEDLDCLDITLKFADDQTLQDWIAVPNHDELIQELDLFRSRNYWKAVKTDKESINS